VSGPSGDGGDPGAGSAAPARKPPTWRWLLRPKIEAALNGLKGGSGAGRSVVVGLLVLAVGGPLGYWGVARFLRSLREVPEVGPPLVGKLLGLGLLLVLAILLLSNIIGALSNFFLSRDLPGLLSSPVDWLHLYLARLTETTLTSSWMVALLLVPVLVAYEQVYGGGAGFYLVALAAVPPLFLVPGAVGSAVTLLLVRVFPARRVRDLLGLVTIGAAGLLVAGLRMLRPERLVNPEGFRSLVDFLEALRGPTSPWLPSAWSSEALMGFLEGAFDPFYLVLLWTTAGGILVLGALLHRRLYSTCYSRAREGAERDIAAGPLWTTVDWLLSPLGVRRREMVLKDMRVFFRDATQWSQLVILAVLVVVYVYNMQVLPLGASEAISDYLTSLIVFLNLALAGFVLAAVAARFVFPAVSLEGDSMWLLRSAPMRPGVLVWSKFWTGAVPLLVLAAALTAVTNWLLGVAPWMIALSLVSVAALTLAFTGQALAWGAAYPKLDAPNAAEIPMSVGGLLFMFGALATLVLVVGGQMWALSDYLAGGLPWHDARPPEASEIGLALGITLAVCVPATILPYRSARKNVEELEP